MTHNWQRDGLTADEKADIVVNAMTEDEKFSWLSAPMAIPLDGEALPPEAIGSAAWYPAIPRLGIPAMQQSDASLGITALGNVRPGDNATALASSLLLASTFNPEMAELTGKLVGHEAFAKGFNVQLAGGANLIREPRGGRNFEYLSEDPLLTGVMAGNSVRGIQSKHVVSTVKHFALNPQETGRVLISSDLKEAAMRESDLLAFEIAIEIGQPGAVMPGYNLVNGDWASENSFLLNDVLKGDWQYPGWVMSDWGATHSTTKAALAGLDVQSGANLDNKVWFGPLLKQAVAAGEVPQSRIDDMVRRILRSLFAVGSPEQPPQPLGDIDYMAHRLTAQREAEQGIVLLKNENETLPLPRGSRRLLVVGAHADSGVLAGGGSSAVTPVGSLRLPGVDFMGIQTDKVIHPSSPLWAIRAESGAREVSFLDGENIAQAVSQAHRADAVIVFAEEWRSESLDAQGLSLPGEQNALIQALAEANPQTIVVLETGGPVTMPWLDNVSAVLEAWYPGSGGGEAIAGVLFGRVNPSGRLPVTFPVAEAQLPHPQQTDPETTTSLPATPLKGGIIHMDYNVEGSDVGYRWFARTGQTPLFPFGYGLSYTSFCYTDLSATINNGNIHVTLTVTNSGQRAGADVPQIYIQPVSRSYVARLAAFRRVYLQPGESCQLELMLEPRVISCWNSQKAQWVTEAGCYNILLGRNATDYVLQAQVELTATAKGY
ncbi:glycoside hydrolase family 3 C-terminal domain-containing protein [Erwinia piriflorinigrans]|uniref:Beta-glucosidase n=1 Tax=Erwinia piriflorinigrans CFBP 5888 TaxID=1161919 RepID=V5Z6J2_9GAMM|nr:glycoside hydrolase family 3 C-terminal domain-containing protein [Erwinia piriflorinigrans]CCG86522.1 beta-glucosidase [Erwinia piriflorinigrans CFBP 5888]